jgi:large subunit ribosomal protein L25
VYGHKIANQSVAVNSREFLKVYAKAGSTTLVNLDVDGTMHNVLIREVQLHPVRDHVLHVDFYQVRMDEALEADVPLKFTGEAPAVKDLGGVFVRNMDSVSVKSLPQDLPSEIEVDITKLAQFNDVVHVSDLKLPEGVSLLAKDTDVVALIQAPRSEAELASLKEEITEDVASIEATAEKKEEPGEEGAEGEAAAPADDKQKSDDKKK